MFLKNISKVAYFYISLLLIFFLIGEKEIYAQNFAPVEGFFIFPLKQSLSPTGSIKLNVPMVRQKYRLSCESAALSAAISYLAYPVTEEEILKHMPFDKTLKTKDIWGDPDIGFVGRIDGANSNEGYGIHWRAISKLALKWVNSHYKEFATPLDIVSEVLNKRPVLAWISAEKNMKTKLTWKTTNGKTIRALDGEHVVLVHGFEGLPTQIYGFYVMDPDIGFTFIKFDEFMERWSLLDQAMVIF